MNSKASTDGSFVPPNLGVSSGTPFFIPGFAGVRVNKPQITASIIADLIITFCNEHGDLVTNLKLQKLLYYAQAWYLAFFDEPLFEDRIEAWIRGPVQPEVYARFQHFGYNAINDIPKKWIVAQKITEHLEEVMSAYGDMSAYDLERLSCSEEPWKAARKGLAPSQPSKNEISHEAMKRCYRARIDG